MHLKFPLPLEICAGLTHVEARRLFLPRSSSQTDTLLGDVQPPSSNSKVKVTSQIKSNWSVMKLTKKFDFSKIKEQLQVLYSMPAPAIEPSNI